MTHTPNPARPSPTQAQVRLATGPAPPPGPPLPLTMQMAVPSRSHIMPTGQAAVTGASASNGVCKDATAASPAPATPVSAPGTQTRGPQRQLQTYALSPVSARAQAQAQPTMTTIPPQSTSTTPPSASSLASSQQQRQQQQQRFAVPPAVAAFKVLQPAKSLFEKTWEAAVAGVQKEFAIIQEDFLRSEREKQAFVEYSQRIEVTRVQTLQALRNSQAELRQCVANLQDERRARVHLERRLAEMSQFVEKCTCGAAPRKISPTPPTMTPTPTPLMVIDDTPPPSASSPTPPAPAPVATPNTEPRPRTPTPVTGPGPDSSPRSSQDTKSPTRIHKREEDEEGEIVEGRSSPKRRKIERTPTPIPTPTSSPSARAPVVVDTQETDKTPTTQPAKLPEQPTPEVPPQPQPSPQPRTEDPKTPPATPRRKIGIQHIELVYKTVGSTLQCRMCLYVLPSLTD
ncbi:hypothetical protein EI94DRAFT_550873 [Lactarius quietus]|nr:hypothetical protein EI94DRAFT_550873 [Lactarius quietus]